MSWPELAFESIADELVFLRAHARVTRLIDGLLEDCLARNLGMEAGLDVFLAQCARLLGASGGFVRLRGTRGPVLTRRTGSRPIEPIELTACEGIHPRPGGVLIVKELALGTAQLGSFGLVLEDLRPSDEPRARALIDAMGEQLDNALLAFVALADGAAPAQRLDELANTDCFRPRAKFGRYELLAPLGAGGMGQVFVARQEGPEGLGRLVAIKRILPSLLEHDEDCVGQFLDEARVGLRLVHTNIAVTYDFGRAPGGFYLAMELVQGASLAALLARCPVLEPAMASAILVQALRGLHAAHELRGEDGTPLELVHRDLSPQNVMVGFDGIVKVLDFGIAHTRDKRVKTANGIIKGKAIYMSPEQGLGRPLDRRSDLFSAGLILYEALTGERPFRGEDDLATLDAIISEPVKKHPRLAHKAWHIVSRALEKDRNKRFATAAEMASALEQAIPPAPEDKLEAMVKEILADAWKAASQWDVATARQ